MNCIKEFGIIDENIIDKIADIVNNDQTPLVNSLVYFSDTKEKNENQNVRKSKFKLLKIDEIFNLWEQLLKIISVNSKEYTYTLVRNDITYIEYGEGDFFEKHTDYVSFVSNIIEEYTMITCLDADCEGGETIFTLNSDFTYPCKKSITPKHTVIFRKDLEHEGNIIKSGYKKILTANILCTRKNTDKIVIVSFESTNKKRILPYDKIMSFPDETLIGGCLKLNENPEIITEFSDHHTSYDDYYILERVYNGHKISIEEFEKYKETLDYHGVTKKSLLIPTEFKIVNESEKKELDNANIILFANKEDYIYNVEKIKKEKLPYVPFTTVFAEGSRQEHETRGDGDSFKIIPMRCVLACFGEHNNIYYVEDRNDCFSENHSKDDSDPTFPIRCKLNQYLDNMENIHEYFVDHYKFTNKISKKIKTHKKQKKVHKSIFYNISDDNKLYVCGKHYDIVHKNCEEIQLLKYIKDNIKNINFQIPQLDKDVSGYLCNSEIYEKQSFLIVYGILKLEDDLQDIPNNSNIKVFSDIERYLGYE